MSADAVVVGAGPNGLVAANVLADAGWDVVVLEAKSEPGGAVKTAEITVPGFHHDLFSSFYPLAAASPVMKALALEDHGLHWLRAPITLANPTPDGRCALIGADLDETAASLDTYHAGDGDAWQRLMRPWAQAGADITRAVMTPFPPLRAGVRVAARLGRRGLLELARMGVGTARRLAEEHFGGEGGALLVAGNALHTDLTPETAASALFGWLLCSLGQYVGFPVPEGGAGALTTALVRRLEAAGGEVRCNEAVSQVLVRAGRARGVRTAGGNEVLARRAVLADVGAPHLYERLLSEQELPPSLSHDISRFQWDASTVKVDWALREPIPWSAEPARRAGTVHMADSLEDLSRWSTDLATHTLPAHPFLLVGQQSMTDPTRQPPGAETAWAYTHVPRHMHKDALGECSGRWDGDDTEAFVSRMEQRIEDRAPGFRSLVAGRHVFTPHDLEDADANLDLGAINGGTSQLHQLAIFRPTIGAARAETFVGGLYLASASAHPAGGVHGACGSNAARAALAHARIERAVALVRPSAPLN